MALIKDRIQQQNKEEEAYKFYLSTGWAPHQASAIVGNLKRESNFNTTVVGTADDKGSQGVAQWHSERLNKLKSMYGSNWTDFRNQLEFVNWELKNTHKSAGDALRATKGVWDAGRVVTNKYEAPKIKWEGDEKRQTYVTDNYRKYSGVQLTDEDKANFLTGTAQRAIDNYNATQQSSILNPITTTPQISSLVKPIEISNLAEEEVDNNKEDVAIANAKLELQQKQNEENLFNDLLKASELQYVDPNQVEDYTQQEQPQQEFQSGGTVKADNEWVQNWYQNRVIPNKFLQQNYNKDKDEYLRRANSIPTPSYPDTIPTEMGNVEGKYSKTNNTIQIAKNSNPSTYVHEANHYITDFNGATTPMHEDAVNENFAPKEFVAPYIKEKYDYFSQPTEVHSRIQVLRKNAGIKPDQKVTPEFLQNYFKTYKRDDGNINNLLDSVDEPHLVELLNSMASNVDSSKSGIQYAQQGGQIPVSSNESIIEIKNSNIQGKGAFLNANINKGEVIGLAHTNEQPSTDLGRYHNHSETPNSENVKIGNERFIVALRPVKKGEEVTVNYRKQPELEQPEDFKRLKTKNKRFS